MKNYLIPLCVALIFFSGQMSAAPKISLASCQRSGVEDSAFSSLIKSVQKHPFYKFAEKRSSLVECKVSVSDVNLKFNRKDEVSLTMQEIAPGSEIKFGTPIKEQRAYRLAVKMLPKSEKCKLEFSKPTEVLDSPEGGKIKTYWCHESFAISVTSNKKGEGIAERSWMIH